MKNLKYFILLPLFVSCIQYKGDELKPTNAKVNVEHIDLAVLKLHIPKDTTFVITNTGEYPLVVHNVETSCGCTTPIWTRKPIRPGKSGEIKVTYDSKYQGRFHKTITVFANVKGGFVRLSISGEVQYGEFAVNSDQ